MKPKKDLMPFTPDKTPSKSPLASGVGEACCEGVDDTLEIEDVENDAGMDAVPEDGELTEKPTELSRDDMKKILAVLDPEVENGGEYTIEDVREVVEKLHSILDSTNEALSPECYDELIGCKCKGDKKCGKCNESMDEDFSVLENLFDVDLNCEDQTTESLCGDKKVEEALKDYTETATDKLDFNKYDYILSVWKESDKSNTNLTSEEVMKVAETLGLDANSTDAFAMSCGEGCTYTAICWDEEPDVEDFYVGDRTTPPEGGVSARLITEDVKAIIKLGFNAEYDKYIDAEDWADSNSYDPYDVDDYKDYD